MCVGIICPTIRVLLSLLVLVYGVGIICPTIRMLLPLSVGIICPTI